ncbi:hypothetical protein PSKAS_03640 [Peribacillus sp. N1]
MFFDSGSNLSINSSFVTNSKPIESAPSFGFTIYVSTLGSLSKESRVSIAGITGN